MKSLQNGLFEERAGFLDFHTGNQLQSVGLAALAGSLKPEPEPALSAEVHVKPKHRPNERRAKKSGDLELPFTAGKAHVKRLPFLPLLLCVRTRIFLAALPAAYLPVS